eukprot:jgi/Picsp_1/6588/NSC_03931-R1_---NA---
MGHSSLLRLALFVRADISAYKIENTRPYGQNYRFRCHVKRRHTGSLARARAFHDRTEKQELQRLELFFAQDDSVTGILSTPDDITQQDKDVVENLNGKESDSEEVAVAVENGQKTSVGSDYSRVSNVLAEATQTVTNVQKHISTVYEFQGEYTSQVYSSIRQGARKFLQQAQSQLKVKEVQPDRPNRTQQKQEVDMSPSPRVMMAYDIIVAEVGRMGEWLKEHLARKNKNIETSSQRPLAKNGSEEADPLKQVNTMMKSATASVRSIRVQEALPKINQYRLERPQLFYPIGFGVFVLGLTLFHRQRTKIRLEENKSSAELAASQKRLQRQRDRFQQMLGDPEQGIDTSVRKIGSNTAENKANTVAEEDEEETMTPEMEAAWKEFVKESKLSEGEFWSFEDVDGGFERIEIEFENDEDED